MVELPERDPLPEGQKVTAEDLKKLNPWQVPGVAGPDLRKVTPPVIKRVKLSDLPKDEQSRVTQAIKDVINPTAAQQPGTASDQDIENYVKAQFGSVTPTAPIVPNPPSQPTESQADSTTAQETPKFCPNCSWRQDAKPSEPLPEDLTNFVLASLGDKPFTKTFSVWDGRLQVTFRTRDYAADQMIQQSIRTELKAGSLSNMDAAVASSTYVARIRELQMAAAIVRVTPVISVDLPKLNSPEVLDKYPGGDAAIKLHAELFSNWNQVLYALVYKLYFIFEQTTLRLLEASTSPNFWKGTLDSLKL